MTRESKFTKIVAWLICAMMIVGMIPNVSLPAAADDTWEGDIDVVAPGYEESNPAEAVLGDNAAPSDASAYYWVYTAECDGILVVTADDADAVEVEVTAGESYYYSALSLNLGYKAGSCPEYPYYLTWSWNDEYTEATASVTIPAGETMYFADWSISSSNIITVNDETLSGITYGSPRMSPSTWSITNDGEADVAYAYVLTYAEGTYNNPAEAVLGDNAASIAAGTNGYYWNYTAECTGDLVITISGADQWTYVVNNKTEGTYGDTRWSDDDPVVNPTTIAVAEGDVIEILVNGYDAANPWSAPAADLIVNLEYEAGSCPEYPYYLTWSWNDEYTEATASVTIPAGETMYFADWSISSSNVITVNGETLSGIAYGSPRMSPSTWTITNDGEADAEYAYVLTYAEGTYNNPAEAVLGDNAASIAAGTNGYYWNYTAECTGDLVITISGADQWTYVVNNKTEGTYGDTRWSDDDPVVNPTTITVAEGDVIEIVVNGYDTANPWSAPAADLIVNLAYAPEGPIVDDTLVFMSKALSFDEYIGVQLIMQKSIVDNYDKVYIEAVQVAPNGDKVTETIEGDVYYTNYFVFEKQVVAYSMADQITITLYAEKDGDTIIGEVYECSVASMAKDAIAMYASAGDAYIPYCTILVDMLNYGTEVQKAFSVNADYTLPSEYITDYQGYATVDTPTFDGEVTKSGEETVPVFINAMNLGSKIEIQMIFAVDISDYELRYTVGDVSGTVAADKFYDYYGYTVASFYVKAYQMRSAMEFALYDPATDEAVTQIYNASVSAYSKDLVQNASLTDVIIAMMKYGDAVDAVF